jgi:hypothetical protein
VLPIDKYPADLTSRLTSRLAGKQPPIDRTSPTMLRFANRPWLRGVALPQLATMPELR